MKDKNIQEPNSAGTAAKQMVRLLVLGGCLTLIVAGLALAGGLWLDARLGTAPRWTLILLIGSIPLAFGSVFWLVKRELSRKNSMGELIDPNDELTDH